MPEIGLLFTARTNYVQARQQEDDAQREVRLAKDRDHHAVVRFVDFVVVDFCTRMVSMLILPRREITNLAHES